MFIQRIKRCTAVLKTLKGQPLTAFFTGPIDQTASLALESLFATPDQFAAICHPHIVMEVLLLLEQAVKLLIEVDWADMAARLHTNPALHTPGTMHEPILVSDLEEAQQRVESCCCWAEVLLLLVYGVFMVDAPGVPYGLKKYLVYEHAQKLLLNIVWEALCRPIRPLLAGLQPGFKSYGNAVNMVADCVQVRMHSICHE